MSTIIEERIAELASLLPMFFGVLIHGSEINTPIKLNLSEGKTLMFLLKHEGNPMTEYSKRVGLTKGSFTTVVDHLARKGLVERVSVCDDRRKYALILTEQGKTIAKKIDSDFNQHISKKVAQLNKDDLNNLHQALETIVETMEKLKEREE